MYTALCRGYSADTNVSSSIILVDANLPADAVALSRLASEMSQRQQRLGNIYNLLEDASRLFLRLFVKGGRPQL